MTPNRRTTPLRYLRAKIKVKSPNLFRRFQPPLLLPPRRSYELRRYCFLGAHPIYRHPRQRLWHREQVGTTAG